MKNLFSITASLSDRYASLIKLSCLVVLTILVEFFLRKDFVVGDVPVSGFYSLLAVFLCFLPLDKSFYSSSSRVLLVGYTAICIVFSLYAEPFFSCALAGIIVICIAHRHSSPSLAILWVFPLVLFYMSVFFEFIVAIVFRLKAFCFKSSSINISKIFLYFVLPLFLSFLFLSIFSLGYKEFYLLMEHIFSFIRNVLKIIFDMNFFMFFGIFICLIALYESRISSLALITRDISFELNEVLEKSFLICLVCFNLIFLSLNLINLKDLIFQFNKYNLARDAISACDAMSIGSLFAGFCTLIFFLAKNQNKKLRTLLLVWLVQNLIIIFTALIKLSVYIVKFSLTTSRLDGLFLIFFLAICTGFALWKMFSPMTIKALNNYIVYLVLALSFIYISMDKEDFITRFNLNNARSPDFEYLERLSPHSLVALYEYEQDGNEIPMNLSVNIDSALNNLELKDFRAKMLKSKLLEIQKKSAL